MYRYSWEMNKNVISILYLKYICIVQVQLGDEPECENILYMKYIFIVHVQLGDRPKCDNHIVHKVYNVQCTGSVER